MQDKLPIEDIKANMTEMMAGGVDTVRPRTGLKSLQQKLSSKMPRCEVPSLQVVGLTTRARVELA